VCVSVRESRREKDIKKRKRKNGKGEIRKCLAMERKREKWGVDRLTCPMFIYIYIYIYIYILFFILFYFLFLIYIYYLDLKILLIFSFRDYHLQVHGIKIKHFVLFYHTK